jgi:hypothetical protein
MAKKTKYFTGLTIVMIVFSSIFIIPTIIEGINIGRNVTRIETSQEKITLGNFLQFSARIKEAQRINLEFTSYLYNGSQFQDKEPIVFCIMKQDSFSDWIDSGSPEPSVLNSSIHFNQADFDFFNIQLEYEGLIYIIVYNNAGVDVRVNIDLTIIPWGHIIPTAITGFLFSIFFLILIGKFINAAYFNHIAVPKKKYNNRRIDYSSNNHIGKTKEKITKKGLFCPSCGTPISGKGNQYCPQCGASIE